MRMACDAMFCLCLQEMLYIICVGPKVRHSGKQNGISRGVHFLHLAGPFVAGVAKGPGRLESSENASAGDHIFGFTRRVL